MEIVNRNNIACHAYLFKGNSHEPVDGAQDKYSISQQILLIDWLSRVLYMEFLTWKIQKLFDSFLNKCLFFRDSSKFYTNYFHNFIYNSFFNAM